MFKTMDLMRINTISKDGVWDEIYFTMDSGATERVAPESMPTSIQTTSRVASRKGVEYEAANGGHHPKRRWVKSPRNKLVVQVSDVNLGLLSVSNVVKAGHRFVLDDAWTDSESNTI